MIETVSEKHYTLAELAALLHADLRGDPDVVVTGIAPLSSAGPGQISFLDNPRYRRYLIETKASGVIVTPKDAEICPVSAIIMAKPYVGFARAAHYFSRVPEPEVGIHPTAIVGEGCDIHETASIGPYCVIGDGVSIGKNTALGSGCHIGDGCRIGEGSRFWANVILYYRVMIGDRVIIHSGVVVGSDGFGMANDQGAWLKVPQLGSVKIGDDVEIGANTTIDRGALGDTVIEEGVKLDNQIQVGHNVRVGAHTAIAGGTCIAGSVTLGRHCMVAGMVGFSGHISIADGTIVTGMSGVSKSIHEQGVYSSGMVAEPHISWKRNAVRFRQLDALFKRVEFLEQQLMQQPVSDPSSEIVEA